MLEVADSDVLILQDCCAAARSADAHHSKGTTEIIAACGLEVFTPAVGEHSFTRALIEELRCTRSSDQDLFLHLSSTTRCLLELRSPGTLAVLRTEMTSGEELQSTFTLRIDRINDVSSSHHLRSWNRSPIKKPPRRRSSPLLIPSPVTVRWRNSSRIQISSRPRC